MHCEKGHPVTRCARAESAVGLTQRVGTVGFASQVVWVDTHAFAMLPPRPAAWVCGGWCLPISAGPLSARSTKVPNLRWVSGVGRGKCFSCADVSTTWRNRDRFVANTAANLLIPFAIPRHDEVCVTHLQAWGSVAFGSDAGATATLRYECTRWPRLKVSPNSSRPPRNPSNWLSSVAARSLRQCGLVRPRPYRLLTCVRCWSCATKPSTTACCSGGLEVRRRVQGGPVRRSRRGCGRRVGPRPRRVRRRVVRRGRRR
jgi:hypothetical protein